jgi:hypothetical protein
VVDVNNDGLPDIIPGYPDDKVDGLYWYENPTWEKHLISAELADMMLWITARDLDGDGIPELAVAGGFSPNGLAANTGELYLLDSGGNPEGIWSHRVLDILPLNHRIEFADVNGDGAVELLAAPVTGGASESYPVYAGTTNLYAYDWRLDWQRSVVSTQTGHLHGMIVADWNGDGRDDALTAGLGGI